MLGKGSVPPLAHDGSGSCYGVHRGSPTAFSPPVHQPHTQTNPATFLRQPKIDFPHFDGSYPRAWVKKCHRFFQFHLMDDLQKVVVASLYLDGRADAWFLNYQISKLQVQWLDLIGDVCHRFEDIRQGNYVNPNRVGR